MNHAPPLSSQATAPRAQDRVHGHAKAGWPALRHRPTSLSTPQIRRDSEHINDFCGLEVPLSGLNYRLLPGASRGASTAGRLGG
jgi:hypothetical protein